jgi:trk system potassium uptake protein TrkH
MHFRSIFSYVGVMLEVFGILALIPVVVSAIYGDGIFILYIVTGILSFAIGTILDKNLEKIELDLGSAMLITAFSFMIISILGSVPYLLYFEPVDAVFESVSGFTTTGLSVMNAPQEFPVSLLFWRSYTQWIGGIGILVIFLVLMGSSGISSYYLYKAEGAPEKLEASVKHSVKNMFKIFGFYTIVGIILLYIAGLSPLDSVLIAFASISTGGFAPHSASIAFYNSAWVELIVMFLMICGSTSFFIHSRLFRGQIKGKITKVGGRVVEYVRNPETQLFWVLIFLFSILMTLALMTANPTAVRVGVFQTVSALTTTGFSTINISGLAVPMFLIIIMMIIGGYAGSTAGGLKLVRVGIIAKSFAWVSKKMSYPIEAVMPFKFGKKVIREHELSMVFLFVCLYLVLLVISGVIMMFLGYSPMDSFFIVSSAQGTVGYSTLDLAAMMWQGKLILMINMMLGRLEIFPFLVLIYYIISSGSDKKGY